MDNEMLDTLRFCGLVAKKGNPKKLRTLYGSRFSTLKIIQEYLKKTNDKNIKARHLDLKK